MQQAALQDNYFNYKDIGEEEEGTRIIRKQNKKRYLCISNNFLGIKNLSQRAKGLHLYILSKPDDWKFIPKEVQNKHGRNYDYVNTPHKELLSNNMWCKKKIRDNKGRIIEHATFIFENGFGFFNDKLIHGKKRIFRAERADNYTILPFDHIEDSRLSLEAKAIHSYVLTKPSHWRVKIDDLVNNGRESYKAISSAVKELNKYNYWQKFPVYKNGKIDEYITLVYEEPFSKGKKIKNIIYKKDVKVINYENGLSEIKKLEISIKNKKTKNNENSQSYKNANVHLVPDFLEVGNQKHTYFSTELSTKYKALSIKEDDKINKYFSIEDIKRQIDYDILIERGYNKSNTDTVVKVIQNVLNHKKDNIRISSSIIPADDVKGVYKSLNHMHIEYFFECLDKQNTNIRKVEEYFKKSLYFAPSTIDQHYQRMYQATLSLEESTSYNFVEDEENSNCENLKFKRTHLDDYEVEEADLNKKEIVSAKSWNDYLKTLDFKRRSFFNIFIKEISFKEKEVYIFAKDSSIKEHIEDKYFFDISNYFKDKKIFIKSKGTF